MPFQFSAHIEQSNGDIEHQEFLRLDGTDPHRPFNIDLQASPIRARANKRWPEGGRRFISLVHVTWQRGGRSGERSCDDFVKIRDYRDTIPAPAADCGPAHGTGRLASGLAARHRSYSTSGGRSKPDLGERIVADVSSGD